MKKIFILASLLLSMSCLAQDYIPVISGNVNPAAGTTETYTLTWTDAWGNPATPTEPGNYQWSTDLGEIQYSSETSCTIRWPYTGGSQVVYSYEFFGGMYQGNLVVEIVSAPPATPDAYNAINVSATAFTAQWSSIAEASYYLLDVSTNNSFLSYVPGYNAYYLTSTSLNVIGLSAATTYYYRVRAVNANGNSSNNSNTVTVLTPSNPPVVQNASNITTGSFTANWSSVSTAVYRLDVSASNSFSGFLVGYENLLVNGTSRNVTGLSPGTTYYYRVRADNGGGPSANSGTMGVLTLPAAPSANAASNVAANSFTASWSSVQSATSYRLDVSATSVFSSFVSGYNDLAVSGTSQSVTGLSAGTTYYYRVRAVNSSGASASSGGISMLTLPAAPSANAASNVTTSSFTANWGSVQSGTSYRLDVSTNNTFSGFVSGYNDLFVSGTSQSVTGLSPGTTYFYRVRTVNSTGASANSGTISTVTVPSAPSVSAATGIAMTTFSANWSSVQSATSYRLDVSATSAFSSFVSGYNDLPVSGTSQGVTGLSAGTTYYYRVRAVNSSGASASSGAISVLTLPAAPSANAASNVTTSSFTASWGSVQSATSYRLDVSTNNAFSGFVSGYNDLSVSGASQSVTGLSPGTTYYYRVRAVNSAGASANSGTISTVTIPPAPSVSAATNITMNTFTANWSGIQSATSYRLDISTNSAFSNFIAGYDNLSVAGTSYGITGLTPGTTYYYRVRAVNGSGTSASSGTASVLTAPAPATALAASNITTNSFTANWASVSTATAYRLDVSTSSSFSSFVTGYNDLAVAATSYGVTGLSSGTTYYYRVRAVNGSGVSANAGAIQVLTVPSAPIANAATTITSSSFIANWSAAPGASGYRLDVSINSDFSSFVPGFNDLTLAVTTATVTGLAPSTRYYYRVRATNASGTSGNSTVINLQLSPEPPNVYVTNITATSFIANWNVVAGATGYALSVSEHNDFSSYVAGYHDLDVTGVNHKVEGLESATTYYLRMVSKNESRSSAYSATVPVLVKPQRNYIRTISTTEAGITTLAAAEQATKDQRLTQYVFFDGLGRPIQTVQQEFSPRGKDFIQPVVYDGLGREARKYLPSVADETSGWYKENALASEFYLTGEGGIPVDSKPYAETVFEASPLNRVLKQGAPGIAWQPSSDVASLDDKTVKMQYLTNGAQEVLLFRYDQASGQLSLSTNTAERFYGASQLRADKTVDEHNNELITYSDKTGRTVCKKVQYMEEEGVKHYASTYYVYDDFGNLAVVLPPEAVKKMEAIISQN